MAKDFLSQNEVDSLMRTVSGYDVEIVSIDGITKMYHLTVYNEEYTMILKGRDRAKGGK